MINSVTKTKKIILAMPAAATEIPVKPNMPAIKDITKKTIAQVNITKFPKLLS